MKNIKLSILAILLQASLFEAKGYKKNIPTYEVGPDAKIDGRSITFQDPDCEEGLDCTVTRSCSSAGTSPVLSADKKYFACCLPGTRLLGSPQTAFDCCADGHDLVGSPAVGFHCCPTGFDFDGQQCKQVCKNGKVLVGGKCVCPDGMVEGPDGTCKDKPKCTSGLETGKCYMLTAENGNRLGLHNDNIYYAAPDSMIQRYGKFQFCADEKCAPGQAINPSSEIYIRDTYGDLATGANKNQWLNNAANGNHIGRTPAFANAGHFSVSKWPCGKYCLGGFTQGVGPACPADIPAMTFYSQDPQMCVAFQFTEVPCDLKADVNNCIWKNGDQCCNRIDCGKKDNGTALGVNTCATRFLFVGAGLVLVGVVGKLVKDNVSKALPGDGDFGEINKLTSCVFWDAMFPHSTEQLVWKMPK